MRSGPSLALVCASAAGGVRNHVLALAAAAEQAGYQVRVCAPVSVLAGLPDTSRVQAVGVEIPAGRQPRADATAVRGLRRAAAGADLVHAHGARAGLLTTLARPAAVPMLVTWHNPVHGRVEHRLAGWTARRAALNLCVSRDIWAGLFTAGAPVALCPVGADALPAPTRDRAAVRAQLGVPPGRPLVVVPARLHPQKDLSTLVLAAAHLSEAARAGEPVPFVVVAGEGPQRESLEALIDRTRAPVRLLGRREDLGDLLPAADLVVLPSRWEGSPLAAQEALAAGVPLLATDVGGVADTVAGAARLVPAGDPVRLGAALASLLHDAEQRHRLADRGLARAAQLPTGAQSAQQVLAVYRQLLGGRR